MTWRPPRSTRTYTLFPYTTLFRSAFRHFALDEEVAVRRVARREEKAGKRGHQHLEPCCDISGGKPGFKGRLRFDGRRVQRLGILARDILGAGQITPFLAAVIIGERRQVHACPCGSEERRVGEECVSTC